MLPPRECFNLLAECQCGFPCGISSSAETLHKLICPVTYQVPCISVVDLAKYGDYGANATIYLHQNRVVGLKCFQI